MTFVFSAGRSLLEPNGPGAPVMFYTGLQRSTLRLFWFVHSAYSEPKNQMKFYCNICGCISAFEAARNKMPDVEVFEVLQVIT